MSDADHSNAVRQLLHWLDQQKNPTTASDELTSKLTTLKELSRSKANAQSIYTEQGLAVLYKYAFPSKGLSEPWCYEALRCLANALTLEDDCVTLFRHGTGFVNFFGAFNQDGRSCETGKQFLYARVLFLVTGKAGRAITQDLLNHADLLSSVLRTWLSRHYGQFDKSAGPVESRGSRPMTLVEVLKLIFNIALFAPDILDEIFPRETEEGTQKCVVRIIANLQKETVANDDKLAIPHLINLLTVIRGSETQQNSRADFDVLLRCLEDFVDTIVRREQWSGLVISADQIVPLLSVLSDAYQLCIQDSDLQRFVRSRLLVPDSERELPLGRSDSFQGRLLQLLNGSDQRIREALGVLLFEVSGSSPIEFIRNVGYGYAVGFLTTHGIAIPPDQIPTNLAGQQINPITGQNVLDEQRHMDLKEMSEEEKEREAEKMFVLFQRLKKNGVIDVQDPIQQAIDSGRFQEL